jgi:hypothetical protein
MEELDTKWIRVSSILAMIPTMGPDGKWGYPMQNINQDVLQNKAGLGSSVHAAIAAHCRDEFVPISSKEEGYLESYLKWENQIALQPHKIEERLYNEAMKLTGCIDMISLLAGGYYITDFKCTASSDPVKWPIQGALYHLLATANNIPVEKTCLFVQLDPKGALPKVHEYEITKDLMSAAISLYNSYVHLTNK